MATTATALDRGNSMGSYKDYASLPYLDDSSLSHSSSMANVADFGNMPYFEDTVTAGKGKGPLELHDEDDDEYWEDEEEDPARFINFALLSHIAVQLRDKVPRGTHVKGSIPYPRAFTGKDIVVSVSIFKKKSIFRFLTNDFSSQRSKHKYSASY